MASLISQRTGLPDVRDWHELINFDPPRDTTPGKQSLMDAEGSIINLDYYSVEVLRPPIVDGRPMTGPEMLNAMRTDLNAFIGDQDGIGDLGLSAGFDGPVPATGTGERVHIDMGLWDDGTVAVVLNEPACRRPDLTRRSLIPSSTSTPSTYPTRQHRRSTRALTPPTP